MNWIYILVLSLATYYLIARYLEKHIDNFDPSLVPVSSIITLAKVAQKLVDGNGTLTNPGNLQIGTPENKGNLVVTGISNLVGDTTVNGVTTLNNNVNVTGNITVKGSQTIKFDDTWNTCTLGPDANDKTSMYFNCNKVNFRNANGTEGYNDISMGNLTVNGTSNLKGNTTIDGNSVINGSVTIGPKTNPGYIFDGNSKTRFSWMPNGSTIVNALPGNLVEFNDSNGIPSGVNINMNGTVTAPILSTPTATITTATITTANITNTTITNIEGDTVVKGRLTSPYNQSVADVTSGTHTFPIPITARGTYIMSISDGYSVRCWFGFYVNTYADAINGVQNYTGNFYGLVNTTGTIIQGISSNAAGNITISGNLTGSTVYMKLMPAF